MWEGPCFVQPPEVVDEVLFAGDDSFDSHCVGFGQGKADNTISKENITRWTDAIGNCPVQKTDEGCGECIVKIALSEINQR
jgi:hypothetical protein